MKTTIRQNVTNADRTWYIIDATDKTLGDLAVAAANILRGKNRVDFTPHVDGGDYVVITNIEKVAVTGNKEWQKMYRRHSGYLGNLKEEALMDVREKNPRRIIEQAVSGMLPKNRLRKEQLKRLFLYVGAAHKHEAQKPTSIEL